MLDGEKLRLRFEEESPRVELKLCDEWQPALDGSSLITVRTGGKRHRLSISDWRVNGGEAVFLATAGDWEVVGIVRLVRDDTGGERLDWELEARYGGKKSVCAGVTIAFRVLDSGAPRWLIPGVLYKSNGSSSYQSFSSDGSSFPSLFCWTSRLFSCVITPVEFSHGVSGVALRESRQGAELQLDFPYSETAQGAKSRGTVELEPGESLRFSFSASVGPYDLHAYDGVLRSHYAGIPEPQRLLNPGLRKEKAMSAVSYSLLEWHFDPQNLRFREFVPFDSFFEPVSLGKDTSWDGGVAAACVLRDYGLRSGHPEAARTGLAVMDNIAAECLSPSGFFSPVTTHEKDVRRHEPHLISARTAAESTFFFLKALLSESSRELVHTEWDAAVRINLDAVLAVQRDDGNLGSAYDAESGDVLSWGSASGVSWIPALVLASRRYNEPEYLRSAERAGEYYRRFVDNEYVPDAAAGPLISMGSEALTAYMHLYNALSQDKWLELARKSADWLMTFRWTYNTVFAKDTILRKYDFRTFGADAASPVGQYLHGQGIICLPELLSLWEATGDAYYLLRSRDNLLCFHQLIARENGDFNARKGMLPAQVYQTQSSHPKGSMLSLSDAGTAAMLLYADMFVRDFGDIIIDTGSRQVVALESVKIERVEWRRGVFFDVVNPLDEDLDLSIRFRKVGKAGSFTLPANGSINIRADEHGLTIR